MTPQPSVWRQGTGYGIVGLLQMLLDWGCFVAMTSFGVGTIVANVAGRIGGALLGFSLNGVVTFRGSDGARLGWSRFGRFMASWAVMSLLSTVAVYVIDLRAGLKWAWLLKPAVDVILAGAGFAVSRFWIYR